MKSDQGTGRHTGCVPRPPAAPARCGRATEGGPVRCIVVTFVISVYVGTLCRPYYESILEVHAPTN